MDFNEIKFQIEDEAEGLLIACSGGPDSICLLHLVHKLFPESKKVCAHFDHRWSAFSGKATVVVEKLCNELGIKLVKGQAQKAGRESEAQAREERYKFLLQTAENFSCKTVLTAHHLDDQMETFFLRLLRGSGTEGLTCIQSIRKLSEEVNLLRPLLQINKAELIDYCEKNHLYYYEDPSNKELDIKRNQIRAQLIPLIDRIQPTYKKQLGNLIQILSAQNDFINEYANHELHHDAFSSTKAFRRESIAIQRVIIKKLLEKNDLSANFDLIELLRQKTITGEKYKMSLGRNLYFECNSMRFKFTSSPSRSSGTTLAPIIFDLKPQEVKIPGIGQLALSEIKVGFSNIKKEKSASTVLVDLSTFEGQQLVIRKRLPQDRFHPLGAKHSTRLKSFLINRKIKRFSESDELGRDNLIVVAVKDSSEILWIPGVELSDTVKVKEGGASTHCLKFESSFST